MHVWLEWVRWAIPEFFGVLLIITVVRWWLNKRRFDRDDEAIKRAMEQIERRLNQK